MELLSGHAKALLSFDTGPIICRSFAADKQETEGECDCPDAYDRYHRNGTPVQEPSCSGVKNAPVEEKDTEFDKA